MKLGPIKTWGCGVVAAAASLAIFTAGFEAGLKLHSSRLPANGDSRQLVARLDDLDKAVKELSLVPQQPSEVIASSRNSVCFIVSTYTLTAPGEAHPHNPYRLLGSGFLIAGNRVVSNRHVMEPWFGEPDSEAAIAAGSIPRSERITAYFPGYSQAVELTNVIVSRTADVAIATAKLPPKMNIRPLRLASRPASPGDSVVVIGYPLGVTTMLAKSTAFPFRQSGLRQSQRDVDHLARFNLIRPSATQGHLVDESDSTLMYDASTAHGSSGGPVFNLQGEVIGVNAAFIDGFGGSSLGVSSAVLAALLSQNSN